MYKLTQNFAGISFMTGMAVSANKDKYKTYQFKEKPSKEEIKKGLKYAYSKEFQEILKDVKNPYGDGLIGVCQLIS